jgi:predicted DNA-binding WGR domain protein
MVDYSFIGWCKEGKHDKVWIAIQLRKYNFDTNELGKVLTLWGRRGQRLRSKIVDDDDDLYKLIRSKRNKGYEQLSTEYLGKVYPEFKADLEKQYIWSTLAL